MTLPVLRLCPRLFFALKPISRLHSKYSPVLSQRRFCSALNDAEPDDKESFEEFEPISATDVLFSNLDIDAIVGDDLEQKKSLQVFISELTMLMQTQRLVAPKHLTTAQWRQLLKMKNDKFRVSYLKRLYVKENRREVKAASSKERKENREQFRRWKDNLPKEGLSTNSSPTYQLNRTSLFHRIYKQTIQQKLNFDVVLTMCFGPDLIVDCSYEKYMTSAEIFGCARQILYMWSSNRLSKNPFNLIFCNMHPEGKIMKYMTRFFHETNEDRLLLNFTEKSYTDLHRSEELVYLTPHCDEELEKYDGDSIYIIGAYVDEKVNKPISLAKARRDGLRTAKFPLEKNLNWAQGSKLLPINQCLNIMSDLKDGANWQHALRHVATRKQSFQICGTGNTFKISRKDAAHFVRAQARRDMLRDLNIKQVYEKNKGSLDNDIL